MCNYGKDYISGEPNLKFNIYDISKPCVGALCYDLSNVSLFLARPDVREIIGVDGRTWAECS